MPSKETTPKTIWVKAFLFVVCVTGDYTEFMMK
jgi:hypothetical protein